MLREEVFSEEALGELPGLVEYASFLKEAVDPVDFEFCIWVLDSFACGGVVFHDLSCAVDDVSGFGDSEVVLLDEGLDVVFGEEGEEEGGEVAVDGWLDGAVEVF